MFTEEEAKTKACCGMTANTQAIGHLVSAVAKIASDGVPLTCIASECMAWRWLDVLARTEPELAQRRGYCGLAGKP